MSFVAWLGGGRYLGRAHAWHCGIGDNSSMLTCTYCGETIKSAKDFASADVCAMIQNMPVSYLPRMPIVLEVKEPKQTSFYETDYVQKMYNRNMAVVIQK